MGLPRPVQVRLSAEGFAQGNGPGPVPWMPWETLDVDALTPESEGRYRLNIRRGGKPIQLSLADPVDFVFDCDEVVAGEILARVGEFRRGAMAGEGEETGGLTGKVERWRAGR